MKKIFFLVGVLCLYTNIWANNLLVPLDTGWTFHQNTKNIPYSQIPADSWSPVNLDTYLNIDTTDGIFGWYRIQFDWNKPIPKTSALYIQRIFFGDETYLNNIKIGGLGKVLTPWNFSTHIPPGMPRNYPLPNNLLKPGTNTLAIKVNLGFGNIRDTQFFGGIGIASPSIFITTPLEASKREHKQLLFNSCIDIAILLLALIELVIVLFLFKKTFSYFPEFPWIVISSIFMIFSALSTDFFHLLGLANPVNAWLAIVSIIFVPLIKALYFWSINPNIPKKIVLFISALFSLVSLAFVTPFSNPETKNILFILWQTMTFIFVPYALYNILQGLRQKQPGMTVIFIGFLIYILSTRWELIGTNPMGHYTILFGVLFFRYAMIVAYFQRITKMSRDYQALSTNMLHTIESHKQSIARELHDGLGQHLSAAKLQLLLYHQGDTKNSIDFISKELNASTQSLREIIQGLHPVALEQYTLSEALQKEAEHFSNLHAVSITLELEDYTFDQETKVHIFRIFQETIHNAIKHGQALNIRVKLYTAKQAMRYVITDDGKGFNPEETNPKPGHGFGLVSLQERVALMNGTLNTRSKIGHGSTTTITFPRPQN